MFSKIIISLALGFAAQSVLATPTLSCFQAIQEYQSAGSEVDINAGRETALESCATEMKKYPQVQAIAQPLLNKCDELDGPTGAGDTGPHLSESCKVDAYVYALNFEI